MRNSIFLVTLYLATTYSCSKPLMIYKFEQTNLSTKLDSSNWDGKMEYALREIFFIENYSDTAKVDKKIEEFVKRIKPKNSPSPMLYQMKFYKVSTITNKQNLAINPGDFAGYSA